MNEMHCEDGVNMALTLSQRKQDGGYGTTEYVIVVTGSADELVHDYCTTHPMAGNIRPDPVSDLRLEEDDSGGIAASMPAT